MVYRRLLCGVLISIFCCQSLCYADVFQYSGTVWQVIDNQNALQGNIQLGSVVSGTFSYDPTRAPDTFDPDPALTHAGWDLTGSTFTLQTTWFSGANNGMYQYSDAYRDASTSRVETYAAIDLAFPAASPPPPYAYYNSVLSFFFESNDPTAAPVDHMISNYNPLSQWDASLAQAGAFPKGFIDFFVDTPQVTGEMVRVGFEITSLNAVAVPEPTTSALLLLPAAALLARRTRRLLRK